MIDMDKIRRAAGSARYTVDPSDEELKSAQTKMDKSMDVIEEMDKLIKAAAQPVVEPKKPTDPLQKKKSAKSKKPDQAPPKSKDKDEDEDEGEGTHEHHAGRALAHLQAAQAHASAAHSAKKVEAAKEHKTVVGAAKQMSEAAAAPDAADQSMNKSMLAKALYPTSDVISWAGQFYGTPLYGTAVAAVRAGLSGDQTELQELLVAHKVAQATDLSKSIDTQGFTPEELREDLNKSIAAMVGVLREPVIATKNNLQINMTAEESYLGELEKGGACIGRQSAGIPEDGRQRLAALRGERFEKATIHQGEHDAGGSRGGDMRETVARAQQFQQTVELDGANNSGQGGLDEWFRDAWGKLSPEEQMSTNAPVGGPVVTGWKKGMGADESLHVIDDDDVYTRAVIQGGQHGEHQSAIRLAYQGDGRENPK